MRSPKCMSWLDAYDEPISDLDMMKDKVENPIPQSTPQVLPSFEVYTPPVTNLEEVEETLRAPIEVEPLDETQLKDLGLNTFNNDLPLSSMEVPNFDEPRPQPQPLPSCSSLDISLGKERGPEPPIKPPSLDSFRMKEVAHLTNHAPPSPHVASFHPKYTYCYYHLCIGDPKKHYGFKPVAGDGVASIKRRRRDQSSEGVRIMATALGRGRLKKDLESSTWRRHQEYKATLSRRQLYKYKSVLGF
nr:ribonuclease H-like domain-containing protein [Tanacetum cinerariifolium]